MATTAYAAIISLMRIMEQIQQYHARQPIFLEEQQTQLQSLKGLVSFFQEFLESYHVHGADSKETELLGSQIADAAHAAEDIIETHIVDDIHSRSNGQEKRSSDHFSLGLQKVIEDMDLIKKEVMESSKDKGRLKDQMLPRDPAPVWSSRPLFGKDATMVFEEDLNHIVEKLMSQQSNRQVIPITGMGGIGKTTLAKNVYDNLSIVEYFDIRGWVTISQQYDVREILLCLLKETGAHNGQSQSLEFHKLGLELHQHLSQRRYLIVIDDIWSMEAWYELKVFLPDMKNGSRVMITTRISNVADNFGSSSQYQMNLLDENKSWSLLCRKVFVEENCPFELVETGKIIAKNCKGLPLSIGVIGGLLAKSKLEQEYWVYIAKNTSISLSSNDEDRCLKILSLSYSHLPIHLKPCFLYMAVFPEDHDVSVSKLIKLWVAEGFLKPSRAKKLEEVAEDCLKDLINRNLIFVSKLGSTGYMKFCKIHDLLRDLCLREAHKERFLFNAPVHRPNISQGIDGHLEIDRCDIKLNSPDILEHTNRNLRIAIHRKSSERYTPQVFHALKSSPFLRSLMCHSVSDLPSLVDFKLLRVLHAPGYDYSEVIFQPINLRYLNFDSIGEILLSSIYMFWNLQTLIVWDPNFSIVAPSEIWKMPQLRHVIIIEFSLPDPPVSQMDEQCDFVLENLQTLSIVIDFRFSKEVLKRIPNVVKLQLVYYDEHDKGLSHYCLNNVHHLEKLQSLYCDFRHTDPSPDESYFLRVVEFPQSLRKLTLCCVGFKWEDIATKIGSLPRLEKFKLDNCPTGDEWNPVEGHFLKLKFLEIKAILIWYAGQQRTHISHTLNTLFFVQLES